MRPLLAIVLLYRAQEDHSMRQLLDLARENAVLKEELTRIHQEAQMLQRVVSNVVSSAQDTTGASEPLHGTD
jgi:hypothetical protein